MTGKGFGYIWPQSELSRAFSDLHNLIYRKVAIEKHSPFYLFCCCQKKDAAQHAQVLCNVFLTQ